MKLSVKDKTWCLVNAQQIVFFFFKFKCPNVRGSPRCIVFLTDYVYMTGQEDCKHLCLGYHLPDLFNHVDFVNSFQLITYRQYHYTAQMVSSIH